MSEKIKPCPFCGSDNVIERHEFVECICCGGGGGLMSNGFYDSVVEVWNTRPPLPDDIREITDYLSEGESYVFPTYYEKRLAEYITTGK